MTNRDGWTWNARKFLPMMFLGMMFPAFLAVRGWAQDPTNPQPQAQQPEPPAPPPDKPQSDKEPGSNPAQAVAEKTKEVAQATLVKVRDWETQWLVGAYVSRTRPLIPLTATQRRDIYLEQTWLTPGTYMKRLFDAGIDQARGVPSQWDDGWGGYTERWASREGQFIASNSLAALGDAKLGYEPRYDQCRCSGVWLRTRHAIVRNFVTYDRSEKRMHPQWALYGGSFAGGVISTAWKPLPRNAFAEGGRAMLGQVGWGVLFNFFTEFGVDINRKLGAKK